MDFNKYFQSQTFKYVLWAIGGLIVLLLTFKAGMEVGEKKAGYSLRWGENYHRNFGGPRGGFFNDFRGRDLIDGHGIFGQIIKIGNGSLAIKGRDNMEKAVVLKDSTTITSPQGTLKLENLKVDDNIVIIGEPNKDGQIEAKFIRLMPALPLQQSRPPFNK